MADGTGFEQLEDEQLRRAFLGQRFLYKPVEKPLVETIMELRSEKYKLEQQLAIVNAKLQLLTEGKQPIKD